MALSAVAAWVLDNSYGPVPATSTTAPIRTPKVNNLDGLLVEEGTTNLLLNPAFALSTSTTIPAATITWSASGTNSVSGIVLTTPTVAATAPTVAQSKTATGTTSAVVTLTGTPVTGDVLLAFVGFSQFNAARTCTTPAGWTLLDTVTQSTASLSTFYKISAGSADTTTTFMINGASADVCSAIVADISGANGITAHSMQAGSTAPSLTATANTLAFIGGTNDNAGTTTFPSGWTQVANSGGSYHAATMAQQYFTATAGGVSNWTAPAGGAMTPSTKTVISGASVLTTWAASALSGLRQPVALTAGTTYTLSKWVYLTVDAGAGNPSLYFATTSGGNDVANVASSAVLPSSALGKWTRLSCTYTPATSGTYDVGVVAGGTPTAYVTNAQLEAKAYATGYCDGTLGSGYIWNGAGPNATSTRQQAQITWAIPAAPSSGYTLSGTFRVTEKFVPAAPGDSLLTMSGNGGTTLRAAGGTVTATITGATSSPSVAVPANLGDLVFLALTVTPTAATLYTYLNGSPNAPVTVTPAIAGAWPTVAQTLTMGDETSAEQILIHQAALTAADIATLATAAAGVDITDDPRITFAAASRSTAGTTQAQSAVASTTVRGRLTSFNTYGTVEPVPLGADSNTPAGANYRVAAQTGCGVGTGDKIGFSQTPVSGTYQCVGVQASPGQYDELYLVKLN